MSGVKVDSLSKSFKGFKAVDAISFELKAGRVMGFLGPNGAGKTTTLRMLVGLSKPDSGSIQIAGQTVNFGQATENAKFGYLPEQPAFYGWMTGLEYLTFIANIFNISHSRDKIIKDVLVTVGLWEAKGRRIAGYSNGMKQRLGIAQALINNPEVIIMDEPVSALDPIGRREVLQLISKLRHTKTILFSTHILSDVDRICDDVAIINKGKIMVMSSIGELKEKYAKPILEVEFTQNPEPLITDIKKQEWASKVEGSGNQIKIWLSRPEVMEDNRPLRYFASSGMSVLKYGLMLPEVEDLFVDLIKEGK